MDIQRELEACREFAQRGSQLANESFDKLQTAINEEKQHLEDAEQQQQYDKRIANDPLFGQQLDEIEYLESTTLYQARNDIDELDQRGRQSNFNIVLYGRTMAGKSTMMEILTQGNGSSIGKGAQNYTQSKRTYNWNGLQITDVPGTCSFGGQNFDQNAFDAAKNADLTIFLISDDGVQYDEAERLEQLKQLGKPVLGIVNVKYGLAPRGNAKRKIDLKQLEKRLGDTARLDALVKQLKDFSSDDKFKDIPFVYAHLQSAFFSQQENDPSLYQLSNFAAVEEYILDKVRRDGKFLRLKSYVDAVARPMQSSIATLFDQCATTLDKLGTYDNNIENLNNWQSNFVDRARPRLDAFIKDLRSQFNNVIDDFVDNHYDDVHAEDAWSRRTRRMDVSGQAQRFLTELSSEAINKMRQLDAELVDDLGRMPGVSMDVDSLPWTDLTDYQGGLGTAALAVAFINPLAGLAMGIGSLFFDSKSKKIRQQKEKMTDALREVRNKTLDNLDSKLVKIINEQIINNQLGKFRDSLIDRWLTVNRLTDAQKAAASAINEKYRNINFALFVEAANYVDDDSPMRKIWTGRIVGEKFVIFSTGEMWESSREAMSNLLGEEVMAFEVDEDSYWDDLRSVVEENYWTDDFSDDLSKQLLDSPTIG